MTRSELLAATGNVWEVTCWQTGNRRKVAETLFIRASSQDRAKAVGRERSGRKCCDAKPYDPRTDLKASRFIQLTGATE